MAAATGVRSPAVKRVLAATPWIALLGFALLEVGAHASTRARVPSRDDFRGAASFVRAQLRPRDLIAPAPGWADPLVREAIGDRIDLAMAGRSDTAAYERLWSISIRGARAREAPASAPELERSFGRVRVQRWSLGKSPVRYDLVEHLRDAEAGVVRAGAAPRACSWRRFGPPRGGGLGTGFLPPVERFDCAGGTWVAPVVLEDLDLQPRYCAMNASLGAEPLRVTYRDVPLGTRLVLYGGLYYEHERMRRGAPVHARVLIDGKRAGAMTHADGDGWKRLEIATPRGARTAEIAIEVQAPDRRSFCWAASTRDGALGSAR
jgi:hypothetical protein